jgi:meiotically up-regulated gene 157 (Mug157) protein
MLSRRACLKLGLFAISSHASLAQGAFSQIVGFSSQRPPLSQRKFTSKAVEQTIDSVTAKIADPELAWLFGNCFPNTLDTTITFGTYDGKPDTFVLTGDIHAMWLRDSSAQVWPYLPLAKQDNELKTLLEGVIRRQTRCILLDPYANAFLETPESKPLSWAVDDKTEMRPGIGERKWELDSLCFPIRLSYGYWKETGDKAPFNDHWRQAMHSVVSTMRVQQRKNGKGPYRFERTSSIPTETLGNEGYGQPVNPVGLIFSGFRPSDDACTFPFLIPSNHFAVVSLRQLSEMATAILADEELAQEAKALASEVESALQKYGKARHPVHGDIWAYEVDGFGSAFFMDDSNLPSLLGLPYLGAVPVNDPVYQRTRAFVLSKSNPYFFAGKAAEGIGGPHAGENMIWPMAIAMRALTSSSDTEIASCIATLKRTHAGTGFMHESFDRDDPKKFTRPWFAWANSLFGELILDVVKKRPQLLQAK